MPFYVLNYYKYEPSLNTYFVHRYRSQEAAETHARNHDQHERINESFYPGGPAYCQDTCTKEQHFHCVLVSL